MQKIVTLIFFSRIHNVISGTLNAYLQFSVMVAVMFGLQGFRSRRPHDMVSLREITQSTIYVMFKKSPFTGLVKYIHTCKLE